MIHVRAEIYIQLMTDLIVLVLSLSYIPVKRIGYSLFTVLLSGQLIGFVQNFRNRENKENEAAVAES